MTKGEYVSIIMIALIMLLVVSGSWAQDRTQKAAWSKANSHFKKEAASGQERKREAAIKELGRAMYPAVEKKAVTMVTNLLAKEIKRGLKKELTIKFSILQACVGVLKSITEPAAVDELIKIINRKKTFGRFKFFLVQGLAGINQESVIAKLIELVADKDAIIQIAAIDALTELKAPGAMERLGKLLAEDLTWEVKISAIEYFKKLKSQKAIEPLIKALLGKGLEGRARSEVVEVLKLLTGVDNGFSGSAWSEWWSKKQKGEKVNPAKGGSDVTTAVYYGVKVTSTRIVFIMDTSGSMGWNGFWREKIKGVQTGKNQLKPIMTGKDGKPASKKVIAQIEATKREIDKRKVKTRMDAAKRELVNTIYRLDPSVTFTIIFYSNGPRIWKKTLVPATARNKQEAIEAIESEKPVGATSTYDALELAYQLGEKKKGKKKVIQVNKKGDYIKELGGADTIFLLSDGVPTFGKIIKRPEILTEIRKIHQIRKIKINTIALGGPNDSSIPAEVPANQRLPDLKFLRELANITGGACVDRTRP